MIPWAKCLCRRAESTSGDGYGGGVESWLTMNAVVSGVELNALTMMEMKWSNSLLESRSIGTAFSVSRSAEGDMLDGWNSCLSELGLGKTGESVGITHVEVEIEVFTGFVCVGRLPLK